MYTDQSQSTKFEKAAFLPDYFLRSVPQKSSTRGPKKGTQGLGVPVVHCMLATRVGPVADSLRLVLWLVVLWLVILWLVLWLWLIVQTLLDGQRRQLQRYPQGKTSQDMFMKLYILSCFGFSCKRVFLCWVGGHFSDTVISAGCAMNLFGVADMQLTRTKVMIYTLNHFVHVLPCRNRLVPLRVGCFCMLHFC